MIEIRFLALTTIKPWLKRSLKERERVFLTGFCEGYEERIYKTTTRLIKCEGGLIRGRTKEAIVDQVEISNYQV